jgi:hypothetical protein
MAILLSACLVSFVTQSISIQSSLTGYISKGIALCGKGHVLKARISFDVASMFTDQDPKTNHFLLLIKVTSICLAYSLFHCVFQAIALSSANQHEEAMLLIEELAAACPNTDLLGYRVVEVSVTQPRLFIDADPCNSHVRHIYAFSSESMPSMARVTTKLLTTSLPLSTPLLSRQNTFI